MFRHLFQVTGSRLVVYRLNGVFTNVCMCANEVRVTLMFNMDNLDCRIYGFTNFSVFQEVYINFTEVGDSDVKRVAR